MSYIDLEHIYTLTSVGEEEEVVDKLFDIIDSEFSNQSYDKVEKFLSEVSVDRLTPNIIVSILTFVKKAELDSYNSFYSRSSAYLYENYPDRAPEMLKGL